MTDNDEGAVVGRKYIEREEAQERLSRLDKKSLCVEAALLEIVAALKTRRSGEGDVMIPKEFPTADQVRTLLADQAKEQATIRTVDAFFAARSGSNADG